MNTHAIRRVFVRLENSVGLGIASIVTRIVEEHCAVLTSGNERGAVRGEVKLHALICRRLSSETGDDLDCVADIPAQNVRGLAAGRVKESAVG